MLSLGPLARLPIIVNWTLFVMCYGWGATNEYRLKIDIFAPKGQFCPKFEVERVDPTNHSCQKITMNDLSCGIRQTDRRTDRKALTIRALHYTHWHGKTMTMTSRPKPATFTCHFRPPTPDTVSFTLTSYHTRQFVSFIINNHPRHHVLLHSFILQSLGLGFLTKILSGIDIFLT